MIRNALNAPSIDDGFDASDESGDLVAVAPFATGGDKSRHLLVTMMKRTTPQEYADASLDYIGLSIPYVLAITGLCGLIFGTVMTRPLRRRLATFSSATKPWRSAATPLRTSC